MARELPYIAAINEAIHLEMERDDSVLFFGQNMATTENEPFVDAFGRDRVRVTPISETAEIGIAVGAALAGYRPVVELYMAEFMLVAMDQVVNEAPRFRYMSGGKVKVPVVLKAGYGFTAGWAGQHTGTIYGMFMGVPGLKVAVPATAADAKGLMATAIRDDNPVLFFHHYLLTLEHGEVPEGEHVVPFGQAAVVREGGDVTLVATGWMVGRALALLRTMWRIRRFEERVGALKRRDQVYGLIHLSVGQEAVAAGLCGQLRADDPVYAGHRAHGHAIAKGASLE